MGRRFGFINPASQQQPKQHGDGPISRPGKAHLRQAGFILPDGNSNKNSRENDADARLAPSLQIILHPKSQT
jgi:hypothetical protein